MFSLFYGLWKLLTRKSEFHILILGLDHAGKTVRALSSRTPHLTMLSVFSLTHECFWRLLCVVGRVCSSE